MRYRYSDRRDAGRVLGRALSDYRGRSDVLVLGLPRGGVPVAAEVASALEAPCDVWLVRKLGVPGHEELAMGAIATGGVRVLNPEVVFHAGVSETAIEAAVARETAELERRQAAYRGDRPLPVIEGRTVVLVDDGLATGATMRAAAEAVGAARPARLVVAVPVGARPTVGELARHPAVDEVVCPLVPAHFHAVGEWYDDFRATADAEIEALLRPAGPR